jgi:FKBP-type peptidyl-prolyl cis-trans isomerase FkpA
MGRRTTLLLLAVGLAVQLPASAAEPALETDEQKTFYALGLVLSKQLSMFKLSAADLDKVQAGLLDGAMGREPRVVLEEFGPKIDELMRARLAAATELEKQAGKSFVEESAKKPGAVKTDSGMIYFELAPGTGESPTATDTVKIDYVGSFRDGVEFDSSIKAGEPASFPLNDVVPCFSEGIQRMKVGGKSRLVCPPDLAYGDQGRAPRIPPATTLVFEVTLHEIVKAPAVAATPAPTPAPEVKEPTP